MSFQALIDAALAAGAAKATVIPQSSIVLSESFYDVCAGNACGKFGRCWVCPPDVGKIDELMRRVRAYSRGLLYQSISLLEDSFDIEGMQDASKRHAQLAQQVQANVVPLLSGTFFHLGCGGCGLCERCAKLDDMPCRLPERALTPMEAAGIDVYNTTKDTPLKYINGQNTVTYFGLLLFDEV